MYYAQVFIRNAHDCFTWHSEAFLNPGARVVVLFRNKKRVGIVVATSEMKPDFKTLPIVAVWDDEFIDPLYISLAQKVALKNLTSVDRILNLMIPEKFLLEQAPAKRSIFYTLQDPSIKVRGEKQKWVIDYLVTVSYTHLTLPTIYSV